MTRPARPRILPLCLLALLLLPTLAGAQPMIEATPMDQVLEPVQEGTSRQFAYTLRNTGDAPLKITRISTSCPCTDVEIDDGIIEPGGEKKIRAEFHSERREGENRNYIEVHSNAENKPALVMGFEIYVRSEPEIRPAFVDFGKVAHRAGAAETILVENQLDPPMRIEKLRVEGSRWVEAELIGQEQSNTTDRVEGQKPGPVWQARVAVRLSEDAPQEKVSAQLVLFTDHPRQRVLRIPVSADVVGDLSVEPQIVKYGVVAPGSAETRSLTIESLSGRAFQIQSVDTGDLPLDCKIEQEAPGRLRLDLTLRPSDSGVYRGYLQVQTDHPEQEQLRLALHAVCRPGAE